MKAKTILAMAVMLVLPMLMLTVAIVNGMEVLATTATFWWATKTDLSISRSEEEVALMRTLKRALDPKGILNRGKIFDPDLQEAS